ncbi:MAG: twin-arginine translocation pathway signal protein, partial [Chthoniobacterales bacterium]
MSWKTPAITFCTTLALGVSATVSLAAPDMEAIKSEVLKQHDAALKRLQDWIALPSIAAENLNYPAGAELMVKMLKDAGFQR